MFKNMTRDQLVGYVSGLATAVTALLVILNVISAEVAGAIVAVLIAAVGGYAVDNHGAAQAKLAVQSAVDGTVAPVQVPVEVKVEGVGVDHNTIADPITVKDTGTGWPE